jgi:hypothetical protein
MKNIVVWDVTPCGYSNSLSSLHASAANVVPTSPILLTLIMEVIGIFEKSAYIRYTQCYVPDDGILDSHRRENLKFYIASTVWPL